MKKGSTRKFDHEINNRCKDKNRRHKENYIEKYLDHNNIIADGKAIVVNNSPTWQTRTNQNNVDNGKFEQAFVDNERYLTDLYHNNFNNNNNTNNT